MIEQDDRSPVSFKRCCTAAVARIIGTAARSLLTFRSDRTTFSVPERTASSASFLMRVIAARRACPDVSPAAGTSKVQSITVSVFFAKASKRRYMPVVMTGLLRTNISRVCEPDSSRILRKFRKRVFKPMTRVSRSGSIGGLVTWLKFCRKKCDSGR